MEILAVEFHRQGHTVTVSTETRGTTELPFAVHRQPDARAFLALCREADVILSAPLSLRRLPIQLLSRRPICVAHPDVLKGYTPKQHVAAFIKRIACHLVTNIAPSRFLAAHFPRAVAIVNPYVEERFHFPPEEIRRSGIVFVGRLSPRKGAALLVDAFAGVATSNPAATLSIVGDGSERDAVKRQITRLGLGDRVTMVGVLKGDDLAEAMRRHAVMVVPSISEEPFGIVALEGLASGCRMVVANAGGLPEAAGPHARYFERGNAESLATAVAAALGDPPLDRREIERYLDQFRPSVIAREYLEVLAGVAKRSAIVRK